MCKKKSFLEIGGLVSLLVVFIVFTALVTIPSVFGQTGCIAACDTNQCFEVKNSPGNFAKMDLPCVWIWVYLKPAHPDWQAIGTGKPNQVGNCSGSRLNSCPPTVTNASEAWNCGLGSNWTPDNDCKADCVSPESG